MDIGTVLHRETARTANKSRISQLPGIPLLDGENILYLLTYTYYTRTNPYMAQGTTRPDLFVLRLHFLQ